MFRRLFISILLLSALTSEGAALLPGYMLGLAACSAQTAGMYNSVEYLIARSLEAVQPEKAYDERAVFAGKMDEKLLDMRTGTAGKLHVDSVDADTPSSALYCLFSSAPFAGMKDAEKPDNRLIIFTSDSSPPTSNLL